MLSVRNFIAGGFEEAAGGARLDCFEPATGRLWATLPDSDARDIDRAAASAAEAFGPWAATPAERRAETLERIAALVERDAEALARAESTDTGKPIRLARAMDIPRAAANFRFFAGAVRHWRSESYRSEVAGPGAGAGGLPGPLPGGVLGYTLRPPLGVVALVSPWNLPLYLLSWKIAPAVACGNTCVCKPSELTPVTAHMLAGLLNEAGLPPGVVNIVHGAGPRAGAPLVSHPLVRAVSFTGGTATGAAISTAAAPGFRKLSLELGGKNATIVFEDADLDEAVPQALRAAFTNQGQVCLCGSRILVARGVEREFTRRFVALAERLRIGDPLDESVDQGALISQAHLAKVGACVERAVAEGGRVLHRGAPPDLPERCRGGYFFPPVVLGGLAPGCRTQQEEIFGPVVTISPFADEAEAVALADGTPYGLSASLWTRDLSRAHRVAERLQAGLVWVNCWLVRDLRVPFGGMKHSGLGREGGEEALRFFTEPRSVCIRYPLHP